MDCNNPELEDKYLLEGEIGSRERNSKLFLAGAVLNLTCLSFVPLMLGEDRKWLFLLIHLAIPLLDIAVILMVFPLMKPYLIKGIREKCENPDINERDNRPLMVYNLILISCVMVFGVGVPTELTLVWLRTSGSLLFVWGFMSTFTLLAGTEFKAARAIREHFSPE